MGQVLLFQISAQLLCCFTIQGEKEEERGQEGSDTTGLEGIRKTQAEREKEAWVQGGQETNARGVRELRRFLAVTGSEERALI